MPCRRAIDAVSRLLVGSSSTITAGSSTAADGEGAPVLGTRGLEVGYRKRALFRRGVEFSLRIPDVDVYGGQIVGIMGHNGAGKSTFARTLCGLQAPLAGTVELGGEPASATHPIHRFNPVRGSGRTNGRRARRRA